jgi:hypothetical protein
MTNVLILGANGLGGPCRGHDVSINSLSDLIVKRSLTPGLKSRRSLGVSRG